MLHPLLLSLAFLIFQDPSKPPDGPPILPSNEPSSAEAEALAKYNGMMAKPPESAAGHWKMALWCEENGLRPEAYLHFGKVIALDPSREGAWQKLGFKKVGGRWMTAEQIAIEASQKKADKDWSVKFKKWHKELHGGKKQAETLEALDKIADPAAVPSIYREFCGGGGSDQEIALRLLGQIDGPVASKVIAILALYGKTPNVRRFATELLRGRPAEEFLEMLVSFMKDTLSYESGPSEDPGYLASSSSKGSGSTSDGSTPRRPQSPSHPARATRSVTTRMAFLSSPGATRRPVRARWWESPARRPWSPSETRPRSPPRPSPSPMP